MPIEITGLEEITRKLDALGDPKIFRDPMQRSLDRLELRLKDKPSKAPGAFSAMATDGQRRAYWAKVSSGAARHGASGYIRTGDTSRAWTTKLRRGGREGWVGNAKYPANIYVFGEGTQQRFHAASGWPRVDKVAKKEASTIVGFFREAYKKAVNK